MNKRALFGTVFIVIIILLILAGAFIYFQVKKSGIQLSSGEIQIDIKFNDTEDRNTITGEVIADPESDENQTLNETEIIENPPELE
ncbi:hypothetical protein CMI45_01555 [Candidatus Pacearchaeota archaeon]|nr:hypothetical protein [Candidatus Pacearchaeota archaeon]|tara:strand:+ start:734 stop:991 length:258 start_codon:yes stop_codon:yes gene_type:complete